MRDEPRARIKRRQVVGVAAIAIGAVVSAAVFGGGSADADRPGALVDVSPEAKVPERFVGLNGQTFGRMPEAPGLSVREALAQAPDFIAVLNADGTAVAGFIKKTDMVGGDLARPRLATDVIPTYADDGVTIVGRWYPGRGFVAEVEDASSGLRADP